MSLLIFLLIRLLDLYIWTIIAAVMMSWLAAFGVVNMKNAVVRRIYVFLDDVTRPPSQALRRFIPPVGGIDFTPMVLIFGIYLVQGVLYSLL